MRKLDKIAILFALCFAPFITRAQESAVKIPPEVKPFIEKGAAAVALETGDLNGDGAADFILVTEKTKAEKPNDADDADDERSLLILVRDRAGKLTEDWT